ncbi:MAG: hypothetical protein JXK93_06810 [Sphaerochaetaceae bacterium]|nr:hypothetical protein [Sphaerochaetaceae bacterium]
MDDILVKICERRERDYRRLTKTFGSVLPSHRRRPLVPFLSSPGAILEIKRSSPSKGIINANLDPVTRASSYRSSGAKQISILTEGNFFGGSLDDLIAVGDAIDDVALLRKDFIQHADEIEVSYLAGADAVLLICAVLDTYTLQECADVCAEYGITPLIEVRDEEDVKKLNSIRCPSIIAGVNSRDLSTFRIDPLKPALLFDSLTCTAVYESGIHHPGMCTYARSLGFTGVLIGEAVSRDCSRASEYVTACADDADYRQGAFWRRMALLTLKRPLVKICGLACSSDALVAIQEGADLLGAVCAKSERETDETAAREIRKAINESPAVKKPMFIAVVTETQGPRFALAQRLYMEGVFDGLQYHGVRRSDSSLPVGYHAVRVKDQDSVATVLSMMREGEPRILIDGYLKGMAGGTGMQVHEALLDTLADAGPLWIAGGLSPDNVRQMLSGYDVDLVDASSALELRPGKKDAELVKKFIQECRR